MNYGVNVNKRNNSRELPIHLAAQTGDIELISFFYEHGADINSRDSKGRTPLHCMVSREYREHGRNRNVKTGSKEYISQVPIPQSEIFHGYEESARFLLKKGANVNARDKNGKTPLYYARRYGYMETAKIFLEYGGKE